MVEQFASAQKPKQDPKEARFADVDEDDSEEYSDEEDWDIAGELNGEARPKGKGKEKDDARFADADEEDNPDAKFEDADEEEEEKLKKPKRKGKSAKEEVNLQAFEVGEYGFPLDGYNYAQHFKTMGGQGAVFVDAPSVKDAVAYKKVTKEIFVSSY